MVFVVNWQFRGGSDTGKLLIINQLLCLLLIITVMSQKLY